MNNEAEYYFIKIHAVFFLGKSVQLKRLKYQKRTNRIIVEGSLDDNSNLKITVIYMVSTDLAILWKCICEDYVNFRLANMYMYSHNLIDT